MGNEELIKIISKNENKIERICIVFTDIAGNVKNIFLNKNEINDLLNGNIWIDSSDILGLLSACDDEYMLLPDLSKFKINNNIISNTLKMYCKVYEKNGSIHELNSENAKKDINQLAYKMGISEIDLYSKYFNNNNNVKPIYKS